MDVPNQKGQGRLVDSVINPGICVRCGACVGICPYFHYFDGEVVVQDQCPSDRGRCLQVCPRVGSTETAVEAERSGSAPTGEIGPFQAIMMARASEQKIRERAQYGGVVSALLIFALENGTIKSAVLTDTGDHLSPGGKIARDRSEILNCTGSRYSGSAGLSALNRAIQADEHGLGVVGLPCQMEALARMRRIEPDGEEMCSRIIVKIGLFCTWALDYRRLETFLKSKGVGGKALKFDIPPPPSESFLVQTKEEGRRVFDLSDIRPLVQKGCALCRDMTAESADLSVGTVEGLEKWNTLVVRTVAGLELVNSALEKGWIETEPLPEENIEHLKEAARNKRERAEKAGIAMGRE
jgi:coenzyme F420 hydrogenase subunit beta